MKFRPDILGTNFFAYPGSFEWFHLGTIRNPNPDFLSTFALMRIGFDAKRVFFNSTGLGNYSRNLLLALARNFPQNEYALFTPKPRSRSLFPEGNSLPFKVTSPGSFLGKSFPALWRSLLLSKEVEKMNVSLFHGLSNELPPGLEKKNIPTAVTLHDVIFLRYPGQYSLVDRNIYKRKFESACERADIVIATSEATRQDIIQFFGTREEKIKVVYQSVDPRYYQPPPATVTENVLAKWNIRGKFFLSVGSLIERKNLMIVLNAMAGILPQLKIPLVVAGKGRAYENQLREFVANHGLQSKVKFLGSVSEEELHCLYHSAQALVFPSVFEGYGIPVLEAMASGIPVVTTPGTSMEEICLDAALYCVNDHIEEWQKALLFLQEESDEVEKMKQKGLARASVLSPDYHAHQMMDIYKKFAKSDG